MGVKSFLQKIGLMRKEEANQTESLPKETPAAPKSEESQDSQENPSPASSEPSSSENDADFN